MAANDVNFMSRFMLGLRTQSDGCRDNERVPQDQKRAGN